MAWRTPVSVVLGLLSAVCLLAGTAWAKGYTVEFTVDGVPYAVSDCVLYPDGEVLVPARSAADMLGLGLTWNDALMALVVYYQGTNLTLFHEKNTGLLNGEEFFLEHAPYVSGGRMMVPAGLLCETVGAKMSRLGLGRVSVETGKFPVRGSTAPYHLTIRVEGAPFRPRTFRALPTADQLRVSATEVAEMFGGEVQWNPDLPGATLTIDKHILIFVEGNPEGVLDGQPFSLTRTPVLSRQELLIPVDSVCEMLTRPWEQDGPWIISIGAPL